MDLPPANTGPGATVVRVQIMSGPAAITLGDTARYSARAYDNGNNVLPVTLAWFSTDNQILAMDRNAGVGVGVDVGEVAVFATAGTARSENRSTKVNPKPAFPAPPP